MFSTRVVEEKAFAARVIDLLPEYLPGLDTGAFEPTDRRRCWNKTLKAVFTVMGKDDHGLDVVAGPPAMTLLKDQASLLWRRDGAALFGMSTAWGDKDELQACLEWLEAFKCPQKLMVYSCAKWQEAVLDQINATLIRYPYHLEGEQYLFMNLIGAENKFHLFTTEIQPQNLRSIPPASPLHAVPGSPFRWSGKYDSSR